MPGLLLYAWKAASPLQPLLIAAPVGERALGIIPGAAIVRPDEQCLKLATATSRIDQGQAERPVELVGPTLDTTKPPRLPGRLLKLRTLRGTLCQQPDQRGMCRSPVAAMTRVMRPKAS